MAKTTAEIPAASALSRCEPPAKLVEQCTAIDRIVSESGGDGAEIVCTLAGSLRQCMVVMAVERMMTHEIMEPLMALRGTGLTYFTDRDVNKDGSPGPGYPEDVTRRALIVGMLRGHKPRNNEIGILYGRFFGGKTGWQRKLNELPKFSGLRYTFGLPTATRGNAGKVVLHYPVRASWTYKGQSEELLAGTIISVSHLEGHGPATPLGKAEARLFKMIYGFVTGTETIDPEPEPFVESDPAGEFVEVDVASAPFEPQAEAEGAASVFGAAPPLAAPVVEEPPTAIARPEPTVKVQPSLAAPAQPPAAQTATPSDVAGHLFDASPPPAARAAAKPDELGDEVRKLRAIQRMQKTWCAAESTNKERMKRIKEKFDIPTPPTLAHFKSLPPLLLETLADEVEECTNMIKKP